MKDLLFKSPSLLLIILLCINTSQAQEYDDIYFRKSDRVKLNEQRLKESPTYGRDSYLYDEIEKLEGGNNENMLSDYRNRDEGSTEEYIEPTVVEKHYYYNQPTSRYDRDFDDIFWSDPYLYQGTIFDPTLNFYGTSPYWRPGWSISVSFGNRWNRSRWGGNYWNAYGYGGNRFYNSWNYNPWFYDNYWCPPYYAGRGNVIVYSGRSGESRGITRGRRYSRNSNYQNGRTTGRYGRISSNGDKSGNGGRNGRYSDNNRKYRNSGRTYNSDTSTPRRRSSQNNYNNRSNNNNRSSRTYSNGSRNSNRSSSGSSNYRSGSNSSSSRSSSSSSRSSKSSNSSRSSRSKRGN